MPLTNYKSWSKGNSSALERIAAKTVIPVWETSFTLSKNANVFALGSCFARNIEKALLSSRVNVSSADRDSEILELKINLLTGLLNKYNPVSIYQELLWASGKEIFPDRGFIKFGDKYCDLNLRNQARKGTLEFVRQRHQQLRQYFARALAADLVIITFGMTETWFDQETNLALAEVPSPRLIKEYPERFVYRSLSHQQCLDSLKSTYAILKEFGQPNLKIVVTLSPVPLERTFSGQDIIVANTMSKSTLRSAIGELVAETENVDYFPSYEAAMLSDPNIVWMGDRRNVTDFIVTKIVSEFINRYGLRG